MNVSSHNTSAIEQARQAAARRPIRPSVVLSWAALALAAGFFVLFLVQAGTFSKLISYPEAPAPADVTQEKVVVSASSISGFDREQQPYAVNSQSATQDPDRPNIIHLQIISGKLQKAAGGRYSFDAQKGVYDSDSKTLDLIGDVHIVSAGRFVATMPSAKVSLIDKDLVSDEQVVVTFDTGDIAANGLKITNDGKNIVFLNRVKAQLRSADSKENKSGND